MKSQFFAHQIRMMCFPGAAVQLSPVAQRRNAGGACPGVRGTWVQPEL